MPHFKYKITLPRVEKVYSGEEFQSYLKASYLLDLLVEIEL